MGLMKRSASPLVVRVLLLMAAALLFNIEGRAGQDYEKARRGNIGSNVEPKGKLYGLAKQAGGKHAILRFHSDRGVVAADLREMERRSTDIIVGRTITNRAYLNDAGDEMHKILTIYVQNVFKGGIINGSGIEVKTLGGSWVYSDGTALSWYPADSIPLHDGASYVFFLNKEDEYYVPSIGVQSIFEIDFDTNTIMPNDLFNLDPVVVRYKNAPLMDFLKEIKGVIGEGKVGDTE